MTQQSTIEQYQSWLDEYDRDIRPMRDDADSGKGSYAEYDEAYNCHLETLHEMVKQNVAEMKDNPTHTDGLGSRYPFPVVTKFADNEAIAAVFARLMVRQSQWFAVTPLPDDRWALVMKPENVHVVERAEVLSR